MEQGVIEILTLVGGILISRYLIPALGKMVIDIIKVLFGKKEAEDNPTIMNSLIDRIQVLEKSSAQDKKLISDLVKSRNWFQYRLDAVEKELANAKKSLLEKDAKIEQLEREREELILAITQLEEQIQGLKNADQTRSEHTQHVLIEQATPVTVSTDEPGNNLTSA